LWACAASLFLSSLFKTRALSGVVFGAVGVVLFLALIVLGLPRVLFFALSRGGIAGFGGFGFGPGASTPWWVLAMATTFCLVSMTNLVLLAENRLSLATENRVTPLRVGFAVQFLLIVGWMLTFVGEPANIRSSAAEALATLGGLHLAVVAMFTVTEDLIVPRRALIRLHARSPLRRLIAILSPGGGRGALYVLAQMAILLLAVWSLRPEPGGIGWALAVCGYICFFTGMPVAVFRLARPAHEASFHLRVIVLVILPVVMLLPDILYYMLWQPERFDIGFGVRHLFSPFRALANWPLVQANHGFRIPFVLGVIGLLSYVALASSGMRMTTGSAAASPQGAAAAAREPGSADVY
jgi:hypothetical protein